MKKYDPILCMMVEDNIKTKDAAVFATMSREQTKAKYDKEEIGLAVREAITGELDTINEYEIMLSRMTNQRHKGIIEDIVHEEMVHVGQLQQLLFELFPEEETKTLSGITEAKGQ